jgi:hypothetical protein
MDEEDREQRDTEAKKSERIGGNEWGTARQKR